MPEPVAALLLEYLGQRTNLRTATNRDSRWPFPGRWAGQPLQSRVLSPLIHALGVPTTSGRAAAIRQHVLTSPNGRVAPRVRSAGHCRSGWRPMPRRTASW